jgi:hypothetical protein
MGRVEFSPPPIPMGIPSVSGTYMIPTAPPPVEMKDCKNCGAPRNYMNRERCEYCNKY